MRIGTGFDVHAFCHNRPLILGGVKIPYELGLAGHSDADVVAHAVCDAILGALGQGDIGEHFPDSDAQYQNISSLILLGRVSHTMRQQGFDIENVDITVILQEPRLGAYKEQMKLMLADSMGIDSARVNIKATTTEHLGFTGRHEGIAVQAVVLLKETHENIKIND